MQISARHRDKSAHHKSSSRASCSKVYFMHPGAMELSAGSCARAASVRGAGKRPLASSSRLKAISAP
ncbi:MAG: hypothetical protein JO184_11745 [Gammaproteobacteria bacterium]|nr:hypothetical protein [Gammaproteobacteria bacterium]MBV8405447.1 hypothetical protein [Gammaproteobacteria bacterium]